MFWKEGMISILFVWRKKKNQLFLSGFALLKTFLKGKVFPFTTERWLNLWDKYNLGHYISYQLQLTQFYFQHCDIMRNLTLLLACTEVFAPNSIWLCYKGEQGNGPCRETYYWKLGVWHCLNSLFVSQESQEHGEEVEVQSLT